MILDQLFPYDQRVENEAISLIKAGNQVTVFSVGDDSRKQFDNYKEITVIRYKLPIYLRNKLRGLVGFLNLYEILLSSKVKELINRESFDAIHIHDLYLAKIGITIKKKYSIPFVLDLHENYVSALSEYKWSTTFPGRLFVNIEKWSKLEKKWIISADKVVTVIDEMKKKYTNLYNLPKEKFIVTPNTPQINDFRSFPINNTITNKYQGKRIILYSGGFDYHRGLDTAIKAIDLVKDVISDVILLLVGDGRIMNELKELVYYMNLGEYVKFEGWQDQSMIRSYVNLADIGLIPHVKSPQTDASIPHKLGYYLSEGLPIISSNCVSLKRMIETTDSGLIFESGNEKDLSDKIIKLFEDDNLMKIFQKNALVAAETTFNWDYTVKELVDFYNSLG